MNAAIVSSLLFLLWSISTCDARNYASSGTDDSSHGTGSIRRSLLAAERSDPYAVRSSNSTLTEVDDNSDDETDQTQLYAIVFGVLALVIVALLGSILAVRHYYQRSRSQSTQYGVLV